MHVWLIQPGEPLPTDAGSPRLLRTGLLAQALVAAGHRVTWWATTFNHASKVHRAGQDTVLAPHPLLRLILLHTPGYSANISLRRIVDHRLLGWKFARRARREPSPDVIHCGFPTIELAYYASKFASERGVPLVLDARDMWPDIFIDALPATLRPIGRLLLSGDFRMTRAAFRGAAAVTAHAPGFVQWGLQQASRPAGPRDTDFPFGYPVEPPAAEPMAAAREFWSRHGMGASADEFVVCFFGTFAARAEVDLGTVIGAARILQSRTPRIRFVLCGTGPAAQRLAEEARGLHNVTFAGWVDFPQIWTLMRLSQVGLLPYLPSRDFALSVPNKVVEYLAGGLPVVSSLNGGYLADIIEKFGCGALYQGRAPESLAQVLEGLALDPSRLAAMQEAARMLFEARFRADRVHEGMIQHLLSVAR